MPVVTDVSDSFLWWLCLVKLCCRALVVRLWFSLSRKRQAFCVEKSRRPPVKAPRNEDYAAHTKAEPQPSVEAMPLQMEVEDPGKRQLRNGNVEANIGGRHAIERLSREDSMKVKVSAWSRRLGSGFEANLEVCEEGKGRRIFEIFSSKGPK